MTFTAGATAAKTRTTVATSLGKDMGEIGNNDDDINNVIVVS
jgi:hypothetical protein